MEFELMSYLIDIDSTNSYVDYWLLTNYIVNSSQIFLDTFGKSIN